MENDERRRAPRTTVTGVNITVKKQGFLGKTLDKKADIIDISSTGIAITLSTSLTIGTDYLLGFELHWLHTTRHILVRTVNCVAIEEGRYRAGMRIIRDEHSTLSFIATAITEQKRGEKNQNDS